MIDYKLWPVKVWADVMPVIADLTPAQMQALGCMVGFADNTALTFFVTADDLANRMGIKRSTAVKHIKGCVEAGWLVRVRSGNSSGKATDYRLAFGRCRVLHPDVEAWAVNHLSKVGVRTETGSLSDPVPCESPDESTVPLPETGSRNDPVGESLSDPVTGSRNDPPTSSLTNSSTSYDDGSSNLCHCGVLMDNEVAENLGECWTCFYAGDEDDDAA